MRLTYRDSTVPHTNEKGELWEAYSDYPYNEVINKLAAYEDMGLSPEEIKLNMDGLDEYHKAEAEGRLVVLPCKVGDTVYEVVKKSVDLTGYRMEWGWETVVEAVKFRIGMLDSVGKTIFLSRDEAEAVLKLPKRKDGDGE